MDAMMQNTLFFFDRHQAAYRKTASGEYNYLVTTEPMVSRKYYDGSGALCVLIPDNQKIDTKTARTGFSVRVVFCWFNVSATV